MYKHETTEIIKVTKNISISPISDLLYYYSLESTTCGEKTTNTQNVSYVISTNEYDKVIEDGTYKPVSSGWQLIAVKTENMQDIATKGLGNRRNEVSYRYMDILDNDETETILLEREGHIHLNPYTNKYINVPITYRLYDDGDFACEYIEGIISRLKSKHDIHSETKYVGADYIDFLVIPSENFYNDIIESVSSNQPYPVSMSAITSNFKCLEKLI